MTIVVVVVMIIVLSTTLMSMKGQQKDTRTRTHKKVFLNTRTRIYTIEYKV